MHVDPDLQPECPQCGCEVLFDVQVDGVLVESDIRATLKDLCEGDLSSRQSPEEITLFKGVGTAIEDLSAAILAYRSTS